MMPAFLYLEHTSIVMGRVALEAEALASCSIQHYTMNAVDTTAQSLEP